MPLSMRMRRSPVSTSKQRIAHVQRLRSSAGLSLFQIDLGTTPNMAPPSSLKKPVLITCSFMDTHDRGTVYRLWNDRSEIGPSFLHNAHCTKLVDPLPDAFGRIHGRQLFGCLEDSLFDFGGHPLHIGMSAAKRFADDAVDEFKGEDVFSGELEQFCRLLLVVPASPQYCGTVFW